MPGCRRGGVKPLIILSTILIIFFVIPLKKNRDGDADKILDTFANTNQI